MGHCFLAALVATNIVIASLHSFIFDDYTRLAEATVASAEQPDGKNASILLMRDITLSPMLEFTTRIVFPIAGGIIAIIALIFTWKRTSAIMQQTDNSQKLLCVEQFRSAIKHLSSGHEAKVLGGVYTLHGIAKTNEEYRQPVFEILCSFIREETAKPAYQKQFATPAMPCPFCASKIVTQAIIDKLFRGVESKIYSGFRANLQGANLIWANLREANLQGANLQRTDLRWADLKGAKFQAANLHEASLSDSAISGACWRGVQSKTFMDKALIENKQADGSLQTDVSDICFFDDKGNGLQFVNTKDKKTWFAGKGEDVGDLRKEEVQELFKNKAE